VYRKGVQNRIFTCGKGLNIDGKVDTNAETLL